MREHKIGTRVIYLGSHNSRLGIGPGDKGTVLGNSMTNVYVTFDKWKHEESGCESAMNRKARFGVPAYCLPRYEFSGIPCMFNEVEP